MAGLPASVLEVVCSPAASCCQIKKCEDCKPHKLHPLDLKNIMDYVPYPQDKSSYETTWERERAKKNLQKSLQDLGPRFWSLEVLNAVKVAVRDHDWYS